MRISTRQISKQKKVIISISSSFHSFCKDSAFLVIFQINVLLNLEVIDIFRIFAAIKEEGLCMIMMTTIR